MMLHLVARIGPAIALAAAATFAFAAGPSPDSATVASKITTVILVRHAEKDTVFLGPDPPLTPAGLRRAQALARTLGGTDLDAIYVTRWRRSRDTGLPVAQALGDTVTVVHDPAELVQRLKRDHVGGTVLVVGHSDTVPQVVEGLGGIRASAFGPVGYDGLWILTLAPGEPARLTRLRYGEPVAR